MGSFANGSLAIVDSMAARRELLRPLSDRKYSTLLSLEVGLELGKDVDFGAAALEVDGGPPNANVLVFCAVEEVEGLIVDETAGSLKLNAGAEPVPLV